MESNTLRQFADEAEYLGELIISFADGGDIRQIVADLERSAEDFLKNVRKLSRLKEIDPEEFSGRIISDVDFSPTSVLIEFTCGKKATFPLRKK